MTRREINRRFWLSMNSQTTFNTASVSGQQEYLALEHRHIGCFVQPIYDCGGSVMFTLRELINDSTSNRIRLQQSSSDTFWTYGRCRSLMRDSAIVWRASADARNGHHVIFEDDADDPLRPVPCGRLEITGAAPLEA